MPKSPASADVLPRFLEIANALRAERKWFEDWTLLRHAALTLPLFEGDPVELARRLREVSAGLRDQARWWESLNGSLRFLVAAAVIRHGEGAADFVEELRRVRTLFREAKLPRSDVGEVLAFLTLRDHAPRQRVAPAQVARMRELFTEIRKDHRWLLGAGEYPTIAMLATTDVPAGEIARRVEAILQRLEAGGFHSRGRLMPISQLLFFVPADDALTCGRFEALWKEFKEQGLRMFASDYDEVALLAFVPRTARETVRCVLAHREEIRKLKPRPSRDISFGLACSTAFLELVGDDPKLRRLSNTQAALQVRSILVARQAAAAAAAS